jgi:hypothetical protein
MYRQLPPFSLTLVGRKEVAVLCDNTALGLGVICLIEVLLVLLVAP